ncbi:hypothetical protein GYMLUDRAFT_541782 [Collybiopsis luxurians FD-317 M1]|nr:hypothetical protein GYMLUDRAFT_541782 [Collybiopsis luxurians FD-317 M1]
MNGSTSPGLILSPLSTSAPPRPPPKDDVQPSPLSAPAEGFYEAQSRKDYFRTNKDSPTYPNHSIGTATNVQGEKDPLHQVAESLILLQNCTTVSRRRRLFLHPPRQKIAMNIRH